MITEQDVKNFMQAVHSAHWKVDFKEFCLRAGFREDDYARAKFLEWAKLNAALREFGSPTLARIMGLLPAAPKEDT